METVKRTQRKEGRVKTVEKKTKKKKGGIEAVEKRTSGILWSKHDGKENKNERRLSTKRLQSEQKEKGGLKGGKKKRVD